MSAAIGSPQHNWEERLGATVQKVGNHRIILLSGVIVSYAGANSDGYYAALSLSRRFLGEASTRDKEMYRESI